MWSLNCPTVAPGLLTLVAGQSFSVGRPGTDAAVQPTLVLNDFNSISRGIHATVTAHLDSLGNPALTVADSSTHGTLVLRGDTRISLKKSPPTQLQHGDRVVFGLDADGLSKTKATTGSTPSPPWSVTLAPIALLPSKLEKSDKAALAAVAARIGARVLGDCDSSATHAICSELVLTEKLVFALLSGLAIVTPAWLAALSAAGRSALAPPPDTLAYLPRAVRPPMPQRPVALALRPLFFEGEAVDVVPRPGRGRAMLGSCVLLFEGPSRLAAMLARTGVEVIVLCGPVDGAIAPPPASGATSAGPHPSQAIGAAHLQQPPARLHLLPGVLPRVQALLRDWRAHVDAEAVAASTAVPPPSELDGDDGAAGGDPAVVAGIAGIVVKATVPIDEPSMRELRAALTANAAAVPPQAVIENAIVRVLLGSLTLLALVRDVTASAATPPPVPTAAPLPRAPRNTSISLLADDPPFVPAVVPVIPVKAEVLPRPVNAAAAALLLPRLSVAEVVDAPDAKAAAAAAAATAPRAVSAASIRAAVELPPPPPPLACTAQSRAPTPPAPLHESAAGAGAARAGQKRPRELSGYPPAASASIVHVSRRDSSRAQPPLSASGDEEEGGTMPAARATSVLPELPSANLPDGWVDVLVLRSNADTWRRRFASEGRGALGFLLDGSDVVLPAPADADAAAAGEGVADEMLDAVIDGGGGAAAAAPPKARRGVKAGKDALDPATVAASRAVLASNRAARAAAVRARAAALHDPLPVQHLFDPDAAVVFDSGLLAEDDAELAGRGGGPDASPQRGGEDGDGRGLESGPSRFSGRVPHGMERYYLGSSDGGAPSSTGPNTKRFRKVAPVVYVAISRPLAVGGDVRIIDDAGTAADSLRAIQAEDARAAAENGDFVTTNTVAGKKAAAASAAARSSVAQRATRAGAGDGVPQRGGRATAASAAAGALLPSYREAELSGDDSDDGEGYGTRATPAPSSGRAAAKPAAAAAAPPPHRASASSSVVRRRVGGGTVAAAAAPPPPAAPPMGPRSSGTGAAGFSAAGERGSNASNSDDDADMAVSRTAAATAPSAAPTGMLATSTRAKQQTLMGMLRQPPPAPPPAAAAVVQKAPAGPRGVSSSVARRR